MSALLLILICIAVIGAVLFYAFDGISADFSNFQNSLEMWATEYPYLFFLLVVIAGGFYFVEFIKDRKGKNYIGMIEGLIWIGFFIFFLYLCYNSFNLEKSVAHGF
jgi:membrane protease YdiL (CAAX protease family)